MVKREVKRKVKRTFTIIVLIIGSIILVVLFLFGSRFVLPFFALSSNSYSDKIIKPVGVSSSIPEIRAKLDKKNIIIDSLVESSMSGVIVGQLRDGPLVYFSKNQEPDWQIQSLILLISRKTPDNKKPTLIDLRASQPIVKF